MTVGTGSPLSSHWALLGGYPSENTHCTLAVSSSLKVITLSLSGVGTIRRIRAAPETNCTEDIIAVYMSNLVSIL